MYSWLHPSAQLCFVTQGKKCKSWSEFCTMTPALFMPLPITGNILLRDTELRCEWCSARSKVASQFLSHRSACVNSAAFCGKPFGAGKLGVPRPYVLWDHGGEPRDIMGKSPPGVAVCNMQWSSISTGTFFQSFCLYATKVAWADHNTWQIVFH